MLPQIETPGSGGATGRRRLPVAAELTDGLLMLEAAAPAAATADDVINGPLQNVKRWMQELQYPEQARFVLLSARDGSGAG